jgi:hypothetical protein
MVAVTNAIIVVVLAFLGNVDHCVAVISSMDDPWFT